MVWSLLASYTSKVIEKMSLWILGDSHFKTMKLFFLSHEHHKVVLICHLSGSHAHRWWPSVSLCQNVLKIIFLCKAPEPQWCKEHDQVPKLRSWAKEMDEFIRDLGCGEKLAWHLLIKLNYYNITAVWNPEEPNHWTLGTFLTGGHHSWLNKYGNMWGSDFRFEKGINKRHIHLKKEITFLTPTKHRKNGKNLNTMAVLCHMCFVCSVWLLT